MFCRAHSPDAARYAALKYTQYFYSNIPAASDEWICGKERVICDGLYLGN